MNAPHRLPLVAPRDELSGAHPLEFERLARSLTPSSPDHQGMIRVVVTLARTAVTPCVPPSWAKTLHEALDGAWSWSLGEISAGSVRTLRSQCFAALPLIEKAAVQALERSGQLTQTGSSPFSQHSHHSALRYVSLAAHFATSAVCHSLDAIEKPAVAIEVPPDVAGARAYLKTGLGSARNPELSERAQAQAKWEAQREISQRLGQTEAALSLQIFHEYLGARWRALATSERQLLDAFLRWALSGRVDTAG